MRIVRHPARGASDCALAIGSFDGVHRGHAALLAHVRAAAKARRIGSAVLTFEPLPREFFSPQTAPARISSLGERLAAIADLGIEVAYVQRFDARFAALEPEAFARRLREAHGCRHVMVGEDFRFGARRAGDVPRLQELGRALGFEVEVLPKV